MRMAGTKSRPSLARCPTCRSEPSSLETAERLKAVGLAEAANAERAAAHSREENLRVIASAADA